MLQKIAKKLNLDLDKDKPYLMGCCIAIYLGGYLGALAHLFPPPPSPLPLLMLGAFLLSPVLTAILLLLAAIYIAVSPAILIATLFFVQGGEAIFDVLSEVVVLALLYNSFLGLGKFVRNHDRRKYRIFSYIAFALISLYASSSVGFFWQVFQGSVCC
jgi:hypothetical protein